MSSSASSVERYLREYGKPVAFYCESLTARANMCAIWSVRTEVQAGTDLIEAVSSAIARRLACENSEGPMGEQAPPHQSGFGLRHLI